MAKYICIKAGIAYTPERHQRLFEPDGGKTVFELNEEDAPLHLFKRVDSPEKVEAQESKEPKKAKKKE